jgi:DNA-binding winged helix-turn-helix (wHTH) protein
MLKQPLVSIFSPDAGDFSLIKRSLPGYDCQVATAGSSGWRRGATETLPQLLIVDIDAAAPWDGLAQQVHGMPILLLAGSEVVAPGNWPDWHDPSLLDIEFKPLRRHAVAARVRLLMQRTYPDHQAQQWQQFGEFRFESPAGVVHHDGHAIVLTQKEFALAILLLSNLGRPLSRLYLQESIWGPEPEDELPTRTIDTHISRVRNKLGLKPANGFRLSTVYGYGYQLERLDQASQAATK